MIFRRYDDTYDCFIVAPMDFSLIQNVTSLLINTISGKGVMRTGKGQGDGFVLLLALSLIMKVLGKEVTRARTGYNNTDYMDKHFQLLSIL